MIKYFARRLEKLSVRLNRPLWPRQSTDGLVYDWNAGNLLVRLRSLRPQLLVTLTTFRRPDHVSGLIRELSGVLKDSHASFFVCVFNDASDSDCSDARRLLYELFGENCAWLEARVNFGKKNFWRTYQVIFSSAEAADAEYLLSLQDDIELAPDFLKRLWEIWGQVGNIDRKRRVLYLFSGEDDEPEGRWHRFRRVSLRDIPARRTDWFDLQAFLIDRDGLALLRYWMIPISPLRWRKDPTVSSGVGQQLTQRMAGRGTTYQCYPPLVFHGKAQSQMNPEARALRPLDNRGCLS